MFRRVVPVVKQVEQLISPKAEREITPEADTATVPEASGKVQFLLLTVKSDEVMVPVKAAPPPVAGVRIRESELAAALIKVALAVVKV